MRPRWSQQFVADELTRRGYPATRSQVARLENSPPSQCNPVLLAAVARVLEISDGSVERAIIADYRSVQADIVEQLD